MPLTYQHRQRIMGVSRLPTPVLWLPMRPNDLFQTVSGTVAVAGDPVGEVINRGNGGFNATQGTAANRPLASDSAPSHLVGTMRSLVFDGTNDRLELGTGTNLQPAALTVCFWVYHAASWSRGGSDEQNTILWCKGALFDGNGWYLQFRTAGSETKSPGMFVDGGNQFEITAASGLADNIIPTSTWTHVAASFSSNGAVRAMYVNGVGRVTALGGTPATITPTSDIKYIGGTTGDANMTLADLRFYNVVLTPQQIVAVMTGRV